MTFHLGTALHVDVGLVTVFPIDCEVLTLRGQNSMRAGDLHRSADFTLSATTL